MAMATRKILVTGATGKQGSAVINALLANPPPFPHEILALTRTARSEASTKLLTRSDKIKLLPGNLNDCNSIIRDAGGPGSVWAVYSVQLAANMQRAVAEDIEERQGMGLVDMALDAGVKHFVYSSVDRGGDNSINEPTNVPHFQSKHKIEKHLIGSVESAAQNRHGMTYTILRPVAFMDNHTPGFVGKGFASMWSTLGPDHPLQLVSVRDIGVFAARALATVDDPTAFAPYHNRALSLAGDALTQAQASAVFNQVLGKPMPITYPFVGTALLFFLKEMGIMFRWFRDVGYGADLHRCRALHPGMQTFETWLAEDSPWAAMKK